jgi:hypothetical protein
MPQLTRPARNQLPRFSHTNGPPPSPLKIHEMLTYFIQVKLITATQYLAGIFSLFTSGAEESGM